MSIDAMRRNYDSGALSKADLAEDPITQFRDWFNTVLALYEQVQKTSNLMQRQEVNAMTLATVDAQGHPSARIVLLKGVDDGGFVFYTNLNSAKASDLKAHPQAALVFYWPAFDRQVRVTGRVEKLDEAQAASYFATRPRGSRIGAWASDQTKVVASRKVLEEQAQQAQDRFEDKEVPMPEYWGGYRVIHETVEFWQGRRDRLHDRLRYRRENGVWVIERLSP